MRTVAIIGASSDRSRFGNKAVRAFMQKGFTVYPVNPRETLVEALQCVSSILDTPERPHIISVYVRPEILLKLLPGIAKRGCDELWLNPGTESEGVLAKAAELGLNVVQDCSIVRLGLSPRAFP